MASNGRVGLRSGSPSFLVVGLSLVIVVLLYSYWSVSSRNSMLLRDQAYLQDRLRSLTSKHLAAEKKKSSAMAQIADMEKKKRQLEGNVMSSSKEKTELNSKIQALQQNLGQEKKKVATLHSQQSESKAELQKLKGDIDKTSEKLKELTAKANSFVDMYKNVKETLAKKIDELFKVQNDWHICQVKLSKLKEEHSAAEGTVNDKPKKIESLKGIGNNVFKNGIAQLKTQMNLGATKPSFQTVKTEPSAAVVTQVDKSVNSQTKAPTGKLTIASGNQSGNDTNKAGSPNNATAASPNTGSINTTTININKQAENNHNNHNTAKPTIKQAGVESDEDSPEHKESNLEDMESKSENEESQDEDKNINIPVGTKAQPINLEFPKRIGSDRYV